MAILSFFGFSGRVRLHPVLRGGFVLLWWGLGMGWAWGQVDSMKQVLAAEDQRGNDLAQTAARVAAHYRYTNDDSVIKYGEISQANWSTERPDTMQVENMHVLAGALSRKGRFFDAEELIKESLLASAILRDTAQLATSLYLRAYNFNWAGEFDLSIQSNQQAYAIFEYLGDSLFLGRILINLGYSYDSSNDPEIALDHYLRAASILEAKDNTIFLPIALSNIAVVARRDSARRPLAFASLRKALAIAAEGSTERIFPLINLAELYMEEGDLEAARPLLEELGTIVAPMSNSRDKIQALEIQAQFKLQEGKVEEGNRDLARLMAMAEELGNPQLTTDIAQVWLPRLEQRGDYPEAFRIQKLINGLQKEQYQADRREAIQRLGFQYQTEQREAEVALVQQEQARQLERQRWYTWIAVGAGTVILLLAVGIYGGFRRQRRFNGVLQEQRSTIREQVDQLQAQNEALQALNHEKDALMGIVAHDLKAPLTKVAGLVNLLDQVREQADAYTQVRRKVDRELAEGASLIRELILLNQLDQLPEVALESVDVVPVVREVADGFSGAAVRKGIPLAVDVPEGAVVVPLHGAYLRRVLENLVSNAVKFSREGEAVEVAVVRAAEKVQIVVRDGGPGIPAAELPRLFEKFTRLSNRPTGGESSTGLGMSIVQQLTERMGGRVIVESRVGEGTEFRLEFPLQTKR